MRVLTRSGFFKCDFHGVRQVIATVDLTATTTLPATKNITKDVAERVTKSTGTASATAHIGVNTRVAVLVVCASLFGVREHLVGFFDLFELPLSRGIALVAVRVVFHGQLAIGFLYFVVAGVFGNSQNFVKISFCHIQKLAMR